MFQEQWNQRSKQQQQDLQQLKETYHDKEHKTMIDSSANELKMSQKKPDQLFKRQHDSL